MVKINKPESIFMDIMLPVIDRIEVVRQLRKILELSKTPIIALTTSTGEESKKGKLIVGND